MLDTMSYVLSSNSFGIMMILIQLFVFPPDILPLRHCFAIFSRSSQSILELISALERGDDAGHDELCFKLQFIQEGRQTEIRKLH